MLVITIDKVEVIEGPKSELRVRDGRITKLEAEVLHLWLLKQGMVYNDREKG